METVTTISKILKAERKRLDLTQGELAAKLDCTQQNLSEIERGESHPSEKLLERMIELFGPESPVAYVARRGDVRVPENKLEARLVEFVNAVEAHQEGTGHAAVKLFRGESRWEANIVAALPQDLRGYWQAAKHARVDYISPQWVIEVKAVGHVHNVLRTAREGMQQLLVQRSMLKAQGNRKYALVLVFRETSTMFSRAMVMAGEEAEMLDIKLAFCSSEAGVATSILNLEKGFGDEGVPADDEEDY